MIVKTPGSQMGSPAAADKGGEEMGGEKCESGERREVQARSISVRDFRFSKNPTREKNRALVVSHEELFLVGNATR